MPSDAGTETIPTLVFGGSGYVAGELLRLLAGHPRLRPAAVFSTSRAGEPVVGAFGHLAGAGLDGLRFEPQDAAAKFLDGGRPTAAFFATPHGATAELLDAVLRRAEAAKADVRAVDLSADFRFGDAERYAAIYGRPHGAPHRLAEFVCTAPELYAGRPPRHAAQPGCFTTAAVLAAAPCYALGLVEGDVFVSAVTGSSGAGRTPSAGTHHPERRSNLHAYNPLAHRHEHEMRALVGAAANCAPPDVQFVPHSGPFVRGIHATLRMTLKREIDAAEVAGRISDFYARAPFVSASTTPPRLAEVVGTNRCRLGVAARGRTLVVASAIDNLTKGAAGGGVQWMNRLFELDEDCGLKIPGLGWI